MADYDYLPASNGSGDAALMHIMSDRLSGSTTIVVDTIANVPSKFIGTYGTLLASGFIDPSNKRDFKGHTSGGNLVIDTFEPGNSDDGNVAGQIVIIKPTTGWSNRVAQAIKNITGFGTPEAGNFAALAATSFTSTGDATVGGNAHITGNIDITGTSRLVPASVVSGATITPTKQVYEVTALGAPATIAVPSYTPQDGMTGELRIIDDGTARALTWASGWLPIGVTLPATTVVNKFLYVSYRYSSVDSKYHVLSLARQS